MVGAINNGHKPFRTPLLKRIGDSAETASQDVSEPQIKKRRINVDGEQETEQNTCLLVFKNPLISSLPRTALSNVKSPSQTTPPHEEGWGGYYRVLWRKFSFKKHKTWDGDGVLRVINGYAFLQDVSGREMGKKAFDSPLLPGSILSIGAIELEIDAVMAKEDCFTRQQFHKVNSLQPAPISAPAVLRKPALGRDSNKALSFKEGVKEELNRAAPRTTATQSLFKAPLLGSTVLPQKQNKEPTPRHDPTAPHALVMKRPKGAPKGKQIVDVVVDPLLSQKLREHQREGVRFMYECVMGLRDFDGNGAILADEMGLGKTMQTIALLWTLLKQNPFHEKSLPNSSVIQKALIVCPVTLISNWRNEFRKWLGRDRIGVYVFDNNKKRITDFTKGKSFSVMIVGYEKLRTVVEELRKGSGIDIVIADEGHRLKTAKNKSAQAIKSLNTRKRIILSGTPIQNDLSEFYMMVDLVNPDLLGSFKTFNKDFEGPIVKSRHPGALEHDVEKGNARSEELALITGFFILRRTVDILSKYLPPKTEYVLLCRPTVAQASTYQHVLACPAFQRALGNPEASIQLITALKKVCNSPFLLNGKVSSKSSESNPLSPLNASLLSSIPPQLLRTNAGSTKLRVLDQLLHNLRTHTSEKIILVSNYTSTLDLLSNLLTSLSYPFLRLDGSTPSTKRQILVDNFNRSSSSTCFAFLLSAKSGGTGLNLVGASRLVLFDVDWNPATDLQAMARIHRDGQKQPCIIYRFIMAGGLDEKIWQRQVTKLGLASNIMDQEGGTSSFTKEELKDLFRLDVGQSCQTHDLLGCTCGGQGLHNFTGKEEDSFIFDGEDKDESVDIPNVADLLHANTINMAEQEHKMKEIEFASKDTTKMESLMAYSHIDTSNFIHENDEDIEDLIHDSILLNVLKDEGNRVSFVFAKTSS